MQRNKPFTVNPWFTRLIEKVDGRNHGECSGCHGHLCWACLKVFATPDAAYQHMNDMHGGNGLVDTEEDDKERDRESEPGIDDLFLEIFTTV